MKQFKDFTQISEGEKYEINKVYAKTLKIGDSILWYGNVFKFVSKKSVEGKVSVTVEGSVDGDKREVHLKLNSLVGLVIKEN